MSEREYPPYEFDGIQYLRGSAGSLILACPSCGEEHFRDPYDYFGPRKCRFDKCYTCRTQMEPIRMDELETRWYPFWKSLGWEIVDGKNQS